MKTKTSQFFCSPVRAGEAVRVSGVCEILVDAEGKLWKRKQLRSGVYSLRTKRWRKCSLSAQEKSEAIRANFPSVLVVTYQPQND